MDMSGEYRIAAPRQTVWVALNDPETLKQCIPGCEEIDKLSDTEFTAKVRAKVGPVSARFSGRVQLLDMDPPKGYRIAGEGTGGAAGFAKGGAKVALAEDGAETVLTYTAEAQVGGKLAQIGSRLIQGTAKKYADDFFGNFSRLVASGGGPTVPATAAVTATSPTPAASVQPEEQAARPMASPEFPPVQPKTEVVPPTTPAGFPAAEPRAETPTAPTAPEFPRAEPPTETAAETEPAPRTVSEPASAAVLAGAAGDTAAAPVSIDAPAALPRTDDGSRTPSTPVGAPVGPAGKGLNPIVWIGALVIIVVLLLLFS